jgi:acetylornithine/succinyldiaminopimelate/putrescine aminotransferase
METSPNLQSKPMSSSKTTSATLERLEEMRAFGGTARTLGLSDRLIEQFAASDETLRTAVERAHRHHLDLRAAWPQLAGDEADLVVFLQSDYVNFYTPPTVNPYVPVGAAGPWIVTSHGAVVHDNGGYGMLGLGHAPEAILATMAEPFAMANVMTPSFSQKRLATRLRAEVGHTRTGGCPFESFLCCNSGSEAVTLASRISDINARSLTSPGARHEGRTIKFLALSGAFHGRTGRPAQVSHSTKPKYDEHLASFRGRDNLIVVEPNDVDGLKAAFTAAHADNVFIEAMFLEPVMGEGRPGMPASRAFYDAARRLTKEMGSLLIVDSIQAGLRAHGVLSIVDYPGFQDCEGPDLETWSKALNAGQYPLSVLAANERAAELYVTGVYGNTMTTNPRALEVACTTLDGLTPELRANIRIRGQQFLHGLRKLQSELPGMIVAVEGTGLLFCAELDPDRYPVVGFGGIEEACRFAGLGVIHGGTNALRFTPWFGISEDEVELVTQLLRGVLTAFYEA